MNIAKCNPRQSVQVAAVTLTVDAANTAALALYVGLGFTHIQTLRSYHKRT